MEALYLNLAEWRQSREKRDSFVAEFPKKKTGERKIVAGICAARKKGRGGRGGEVVPLSLPGEKKGEDGTSSSTRKKKRSCPEKSRAPRTVLFQSDKEKKKKNKRPVVTIYLAESKQGRER